MSFFAERLAAAKYRVVRFEFPYMAKRRETGKKAPPDREPKLRDAWKQVIAEQGKRRLVIGGKSMGGRIASLIADEVAPLGLCCLGYPFHPPGKPQNLRVEHLKNLQTPTLILQGERDALGSASDVAGYTLSDHIQVHWLPDGDHGFKPRKSSGRSEIENWTQAADAMSEFLQRRLDA